MPFIKGHIIYFPMCDISIEILSIAETVPFVILVGNIVSVRL
jgi:hypothetical protein